MNMKIQKIKGSTLILVLIILFVAAILMLFTMSAVVYQSKLVKTQQQKSRADLFAESALNIVSNDFLEDPSAFLANPETERTLESMGVCSSTATDLTKKCNADSKVYIKKLDYILAYRLKHGETIQVDLADKNNSPTVGAIDIMFTNPNYDNDIDRLLITGYYYQNPGSPSATLKPTGACIINYKEHLVSTSCVGQMQLSGALSIPADKADYGNNRIRLTFTNSATRSHFIRIKGIYSNDSKETWVSVTGPNYSNLPLPQEVVLKSVAYSYDAKGEIVQSKIVKTLFAHPEMPEVMDWVFYNGANSSVVK